ncbi:MAG: pilus assembly protein PilM, partial [Candidatus Omnitrophota bacterium]
IANSGFNGMIMEKGSNSVYITDNFIRFGIEALPEINIRSLNKEEVVEKLKALFKNNRSMSEHLVLGIPRTQVAVKYLTLPALNDQEIAKMAGYELNNLFPYKPDELIYDYTVISKGSDGYSRVMLVAAPKESILSRIRALSLAGLVPESINISTVSLFNQFSARERRPDDYLLINLDDAFMEMLLINEGKLSFSRGISLKGPGEIKNLVKKVEENITIIRNKGGVANAIILCGQGQELKDFAHALEKIMPSKVEIDDSLAVLKGLAPGTDSGVLKINLLPEELKIHRLKNKRKSANLLFISLLILNLSLCANIVFQKIKVRQEYLSFIKAQIQEISPQTHTLREKKLKTQIVKISINSARLTLSLLAELYRAAPEEISLNTMAISQQKIPGVLTLTGQAGDSESVLRFADALKESAIIKSADVGNISRLKSAKEEGMVGFEIRVNLE